MNVLGINYYFHDSSACIVVDGKLIVALEEERFTRNKHTREFPERAIAECFEVAGIGPEDIDHIAVSIQPTQKWKQKALYTLRHATKAAPFIKHEYVAGYFKQKKLRQFLQQTFKDCAKAPQVEFVEHHLAHASGSFLVSPYDDAAILALDGSGEWACAWTGHGKGNKIECFNESYFPNSLGAVYESVTEFCGFRPNYDEGKTMGLAPLGNASRFFDAANQLVWLNENGQLQVDLSYFSYQFWGYKRCSQKFYDVFGAPRAADAEFEQHHMDVAAAFQKVLEERALEMANSLYKRTGAEHLIIAGGVALNSVMNGRLLRETSFKDVYIMPAAGDNGTCIGAAYHLYNCVLGKPRNFVHDNPFVGNEYSNEEIERLLKQYKLNYEFVEDITQASAELLFNGDIIGWFQGRMEIGPRALGARSILANPVFPQMKAKINSEVKYREAYRPFAPSATVEDCRKYFDLEVEAPFMLKVCDVKPEYRAQLPAITHVDGSARLQTVSRKTNPRYHQLIERLGEKSGFPVILNTSFNVQGEPVVESPRDAVRCFFSNGLDKLVIGNFVVSK